MRLPAKWAGRISSGWARYRGLPTSRGGWQPTRPASSNVSGSGLDSISQPASLTRSPQVAQKLSAAPLADDIVSLKFLDLIQYGWRLYDFWRQLRPKTPLSQFSDLPYPFHKAA